MSTTPERTRKPNVRWRRGYEASGKPPSGLRGTLIRLFGGDVPAWPPAPQPLPASGDPDSIELPDLKRPSPVSAGARPVPPTPVKLPPTTGDLMATQALPATVWPTEIHPGKEQTVAAFGIDLKKLKAPRYQYVLQVFDDAGNWRDWGSISSQGMSIGRAAEIDGLPALRSLAKRHMRLSYQDADLVVEDLGSINGVFKRLRGPTLLTEGTLFRIGGYLFCFHLAEPAVPSTPLISPDGEEFAARDPVAYAFLDMIGADGTPHVRIPILRTDSTTIGREPAEVNLAFKDSAISSLHAEIHREERGFLLDDLKSRNGTYIALPRRAPIEAGDILLIGQMLFRIHDPTA